jgi:hypothetical protein
VAKWESWRNNSSYNSTSDTRKHRANCSENHLKGVGIDRHLTDQDVERKNCSGGNNQYPPTTATTLRRAKRNRCRMKPPYIILRLWHTGNLAKSCFRLSRTFVN